MTIESSYGSGLLIVFASTEVRIIRWCSLDKRKELWLRDGRVW